MLQKLKTIESLIGNTQLRRLYTSELNAELNVKLEYGNFSGSIKSRPAFYILKKAIESGILKPGSVIVESSSGNFAIALAMLSKVIGLKFIPVIDPNINPDYEKLLNYLCGEVVKVSKRDKTGGYLLTRLEAVDEICRTRPNVFWPNQYANGQNAQAYYSQMGGEIRQALDRLDYAFIGVSSCGTIAGLSRRLKEEYPNIKIVAVDVEGSVIFSKPPRKRLISGIGSSIVPPLLKQAHIDEYIHVSQTEIVSGCHELMSEHMIFAGASSGAVYKCIKNYFSDKPVQGPAPKVLFICPDHGSAYLDTIYNKAWIKMVEELELNYSTL